MLNSVPIGLPANIDLPPRHADDDQPSRTDLSWKQTPAGGYTGTGPHFGTDVGVRATFLTHEPEKQTRFEAKRRSQSVAPGYREYPSAANVNRNVGSVSAQDPGRPTSNPNAVQAYVPGRMYWLLASAADRLGVSEQFAQLLAVGDEIVHVQIAHHGPAWVHCHELQLRDPRRRENPPAVNQNSNGGSVSVQVPASLDTTSEQPAPAIRDHAGMNIDMAVGCDSITVYSNTTDPVYIPCPRDTHMQASHVVEMAGRSTNTSALFRDGVMLTAHQYVPSGSEVLICAVVSLQAPTLAGPKLTAANMQHRLDLIGVLERHGLGRDLLISMFTKTVDKQAVPGFRWAGGTKKKDFQRMILQDDPAIAFANSPHYESVKLVHGATSLFRAGVLRPCHA